MSCCDQSTPTQPRHCGACTVCCVHLPIAEGVLGPDAKPAGTPCPHVGVLGCRRYSARPQVCVAFRCAWLDDPAWSLGWRPDRSGLLCLRAEVDEGIPAGLVYEVRPDALASDAAVEILAELRRTTTMLATIDVNGQETRLSGQASADPPHNRVPAPHFRRSRSDVRRAAS